LSFQIGPGMHVRLSYRVFDEEGEALHNAPEELSILVGYGALLPAIEERLDGLQPGEVRRIELPAQRAFGRRDPKAIVEVERGEFPPDVAAGDRFDAEGADGKPVVLQVLDVTDDAVIVDGNHPLAGQRVCFEIAVREVRPASAEELAAAEERLEGGLQGDNSRIDALIPLGRLLRGPSQR
jgi:FKBP-type peptidyl-prolyl cis-trans isomerase SlyD